MIEAFTRALCLMTASVILASFHASAAAALDAPLPWLASRAHGAPCPATDTCARYLECDPATATCVNPPDLSLQLTGVEGCARNIYVGIQAQNQGEVMLNEEVLLEIQTSMVTLYSRCSGGGDDWGTNCLLVVDPLPQTSYTTIPVQLHIPPGASDWQL